MKGFEVFTIVSWVLQPGLAGYALRLNRVFGSQRVGWWVFTAFGGLACLQWMHLLQPSNAGAGFIDVFILALLRVGMVSGERVWAGRVQVEFRREKLEREVQRLMGEAETLGMAHQNLLQQLLQREQSESGLSVSERQMRTLFMENPVAMWVFDLRSLRVLAANEAACRLYGFGRDEWSGLTAKRLHAESDVPALLRECGIPSCGSDRCLLWRHCRKDGTLLHVAVSDQDLLYDERPARMLAVRAV